MEQSEQTQKALDAKIHTAIKNYCDTKRHPVRTEKAFLAFDFLRKHASAREVYLHRGEYLFLFSKAVYSLKRTPQTGDDEHNESVQYTPQIVELTDWFVAQRQPADSLYKTRLKGLFRLLKDQNLPVAPEKYEEWSRLLAPKRPPVKNLPLIQAPEITYHCTFDDRARRSRDIDY